MARYRSSMRMGALNLLILVIAVSLAVLGVLSLVTAQANTRLANRQADSISEIYVEDSAGQFFLQRLDHELSSGSGNTSPDAMIASLSANVGKLAQSAAQAVSSDSVDVEGSAAVLDMTLLYAEMGVPSNLIEPTDSDTNSGIDSTPEVIVSDITPMTNEAGEGMSADGVGASGGQDAKAQDGDDSGEDSGDDSKRPVPEIIHDVVVLEAIDSRSVEAAPLENSKSDYAASLRAYIDGCICGVSADFSTASGRNLHCVLAINSDYSYKVLSWKITKAWPEGSQDESLWLG